MQALRDVLPAETARLLQLMFAGVGKWFLGVLAMLKRIIFERPLTFK